MEVPALSWDELIRSYQDRGFSIQMTHNPLLNVTRFEMSKDGESFTPLAFQDITIAEMSEEDLVKRARTSFEWGTKKLSEEN